jgi:hypothetical protein
VSKLADMKPAGAGPSADPDSGTMTTERWLALIVAGAFGFLVFTRRAFSEFIPR